MNAHHVVIIGAGYAGLTCAISLARNSKDLLQQRKLRITLVNRDSRHEMSAEFPRLLHIGKLDSIGLSSICQKHKIHFHEGTLVAIDPFHRQLVLQDWEKSEIQYDTLILATGSSPKTPSIHGMESFLSSEANPSARKCFFFHSLFDVQALRAELRRMRWDDDPGPEAENFVVVVGAGDLGLQIAGTLASMRKNISKNRLILVDQKRTLAEDLSPIAQKLLNRDLKSMVIETVLGSPATSISPRALHIENGQIIPWDLMILATGQHVQLKALESLGAALGTRGLRVDTQLQIQGFPHHFAIGDVADVRTTRHPLGAAIAVPKNEMFAREQGLYLADQFSAALRRGSFQSQNFIFESYRPTDWGHFISLGPRRGVARIGRTRFSRMSRMLSPFLYGPAVYQSKKLSYWMHRAHIQRPF